MREDTNFKGSDLSCPSIYFLFYGLAYIELSLARFGLLNLSHNTQHLTFRTRKTKKYQLDFLTGALKQNSRPIIDIEPKLHGLTGGKQIMRSNSCAICCIFFNYVNYLTVGHMFLQTKIFYLHTAAVHAELVQNFAMWRQ